MEDIELDYDFLAGTILYSIPGFAEFGIMNYSGISETELENEIKAALLRLKKSRIFYTVGTYQGRKS